MIILGKAHDKVDSKKRKIRKLIKDTKAEKESFYNSCRFLIKQMHEFGRTYGFLSWVAYNKEESKEVVLRANFLVGDMIALNALDAYIQDLSNITKIYVRRMGKSAIENSTPEGVIRSMCTILWNQLKDRNSPPSDENKEKIDEV